jgi:hypothetical protein
MTRTMFYVDLGLVFLFGYLAVGALMGRGM